MALLLRRALAFAVDCVMLLVAAAAATLLLPTWIWTDWTVRFSLIAVALYFGLFEGLSLGQTPGKAACRLRIAGVSGSPVTVYTATARATIWLIFPALVPLSYEFCEALRLAPAGHSWQVSAGAYLICPMSILLGRGTGDNFQKLGTPRA